MPNLISTDLQLDLVLDAALTAFTAKIAPLNLFSLGIQAEPLQGTDKIQVPYYPLETAVSKDFAGTYVMDGSDTQSREVIINKRKYQSLSWTSSEQRRQPAFDPVKLGQMKGQKLAEDVLADIWSVITAANFGTAGFIGVASAYNVVDVINQGVAATVANWPLTQRGIIVGPTYIGELQKDMNVGGGLATFGRDSNGELTEFPSIEGFDFASSNLIPGNGENLVGFSVFPSAILVGFSPIEPTEAVMKNLIRYERVSNESGMSLEFREWGDPDTDTTKTAIEVNYGFGLGEAAALSRMTSV